jgi:SAM-dependent methyltransferase
MSDDSKQATIQQIQSDYRRRLADTWKIAPGSRILEIGCGQGDMTAILADRVGPTGHVVAVDVAGPDYGAPLTLGEATDLIKASPVGNRVDFHFNFNVLDPQKSFDDDAFDNVVLAHCSWYFASPEALLNTLRTVKPWARRLCFAEWDLQPRSLDQVPHLLAVLIQGQVEAFKTTSRANVRTPLSVDRLRQIIGEAGWSIKAESSVETVALQDADWEIAACLADSMREARAMNLPYRFISHLESQIDVLKSLATPTNNRPLSSLVLIADR